MVENVGNIYDGREWYFNDYCFFFYSSVDNLNYRALFRIHLAERPCCLFGIDATYRCSKEIDPFKKLINLPQSHESHSHDDVY